jgi:hypothetical protein
MSELRTQPGLPPHLASRARSIRIAAAIAVVAALASVAAGWVVRGLSDSAPAPVAAAPARTAHAGAAAIEVPAEWVPVSAAPGVTGLDPHATASFQPAAALAAYAVVTFSPAEDASLVPAPLRGLLPATLPKPRAASLGGARAWRYGELPAPGNRTIELTVAPATSGVLTIACVSTREAWVAALGCAQQLRSVSLDRGTWLRPGSEVAVRMRIPGAIEQLDQRRVAIRAKLRRAGSHGAQHRLAIRLAAAYTLAADRLAPAAPRTGAPTRVIAALRAAAGANRELAVAAGHGWPKRYRQARRAVRRGDAVLKRSLAALR